MIASAAGGPEVLALQEVPDPVVGPGELLVRVSAAGVNRADLIQRRGLYPPPAGSSEIIGLECSGRVAALGAGVTGWKVDEPCVALLAGGGYAELVAVPAGQVVRPPLGVDLIAAAGLIEVAATVVSNLDLADLHATTTFLVHGGSGGVGSFAIAYAKAQGATVLATAGSEPKLDYCRSMGADLAVSYREDWPAAVADFTCGAGVDVILDVMGAKYLDANLAALAPDGRLMIIGLQGGRSATVDLGRLLSRRAAIFATTLRSRPPEQKAAICTAVVERVWPLIESKTIPLAPQTVFDITAVTDAHRQLESGDNVGKIVLRVGGNG